MTSTTSTTTRGPRATLILLGLLCGSAAMALPMPTSQGLAEAEARYRDEMAICNSGRSSQDVATCRREARNALAEYKRGRLDNSGNLSANARQRCDALDGDDKRDCLARTRGEGLQEGSVAGGGILRETITTVVPANKQP